MILVVVAAVFGSALALLNAPTDLITIVVVACVGVGIAMMLPDIRAAKDGMEDMKSRLHKTDETK